MVAIPQRAAIVWAEFAGFGNRMPLRLVDLPRGNVEDLVAAGPPLIDAAALRARRRPTVGVVLVEKRVEFAAPLLRHFAVAVIPAVRAVDFINQEPQE